VLDFFVPFCLKFFKQKVFGFEDKKDKKDKIIFWHPRSCLALRFILV
jgi:hypothetical protein